VIDCHYGGSSYFCEVQNDPVTTSKDSRDITGVRGTHLSGKTNDDVIRFDIISNTVNYFPRGITKYFKNIRIVEIGHANLKEITKEDLKEFGDKLKKLYLLNNQIEVIEADLFIYNKNLEDISMTNKIKHIENGAFDHLKNLNTLYLGDNPCTSGGNAYAHSRSDVITLIENVEKKCKEPSKDRNIRFIVTEITTTMKTLQEENSKNFENLKIFFESEILKQKNKYEETSSTLDSKFEQLKSEFLTLTSNLVEKCENHKNILVSEYAKQTMKNEQNLEKMALEIGEKIEGSCKREEPTSEN
jgi:hypothetical protein